MTALPTLDWTKGQGLVPAIVQDAETQQVLMLGYMDQASLAQTLATRRVTFRSRRTHQLWVKGESSGHFLDLVDVTVDCDQDALLVRARPVGPTCHRGTVGCFGEHGASGAGFLAHLERVVAARIGQAPEQSYTAGLAQQGLPRVAQKVGEEAIEVVLAAVAEAGGDLAGEAADLLFHLLVLLRVRGVALAEVLQVLERRHAQPTDHAPPTA
jgi:phosphoribosyl-ATP pyrophosphohydrolase/phosphoribosyl-AMP cyclohydrolase